MIAVPAMKQLLSLKELSRPEIEALFQLADEARERPKAQAGRLAGKTLAMLFERPSTRTRAAFETAISQLGGHALFLRADDTHLSRGESIADTARSLSELSDGVALRLTRHQDVLDFAKHASVPVINGLSDALHPLQALADLYTLRLRRGRTDGVKLAYVGDGNNVCHELLFGGVKLGLSIAVASPEGYGPSPVILKIAQRDAQKARGPLPAVGQDPATAVAGADAVYTDVWTSMGFENQAADRQQAFRGFSVTPALLSGAREDAIFMHPLPARRGEEVAAEVIDGPHSVVFEQVKNRLFVHKAVLLSLLGS